MSWLLLTLLGILAFSPKNLLYRTLKKGDQSDPYAQSVVFFGLGGTICFFFAYQAGRNAAQIVPLGGLITIISMLLSIPFLKEYSSIPHKVVGALLTLVGAALVL
jgi:uncharacterized membrane protein